MTEQMWLRRGLKEFVKAGADAVEKDLAATTQPSECYQARPGWEPDQRAALNYLMYIKNRRDVDE